MVVLLVLFTIAVFLSIDSFRNWNKNRIRVPAWHDVYNSRLRSAWLFGTGWTTS